jgi:hypothetical protein
MRRRVAAGFLGSFVKRPGGVDDPPLVCYALFGISIERSQRCGRLLLRGGSLQANSSRTTHVP